MTEPEATEPEEMTPVEESPVVEDVAAEDATDAELRQWAKDNGIEGVPASGRLSAAWREQITAAMAQQAIAEPVLDPKEEASAEAAITPESSMPETTTEQDGSEEEPAIEIPIIELIQEPEPEPVLEPEPAPYRAPWVPPATWVSGQTFTA